MMRNRDIETFVLNRRFISTGASGGARRSCAVLVLALKKEENGKTYFGVGKGKGKDFAAAYRSATNRAIDRFERFPERNGTIYHDIVGKSKCTKIFLKKRKASGVIAGGVAINFFKELNGICAKFDGRSNPYNMVYAIMDGLRKQESVSQIAARRGLKRSKFIQMVNHSFGKRSINE